MTKIKEEEEKKFYLEAVKNYGWSRNELNIQIKADTFKRQLSLDKTNNFKGTLPSHLAKQADEIMKSDYMLDFLGLHGTYLEKDLEKKMVEKHKKLEKKSIPDTFNYDRVSGFRKEAREKLKMVRPLNVGQASRISGISPADISILIMYLEGKIK